MSGNKRKLSFLAFAPQEDNEDQVLLDEEMDRVVWNETLPGPSHPLASRGGGEAPCRDQAAPRPTRRGPGGTVSASDLSPSNQDGEDGFAVDKTGHGSSSWGTISAGSTRTVNVDDKKVQFDHHCNCRPEVVSSDDSDERPHGRFLDFYNYDSDFSLSETSDSDFDPWEYRPLREVRPARR